MIKDRNVVDIAIGVALGLVLGGPFGKVINSLLNDILFPLTSRLLGGIDLAGLFINLSNVKVSSLAEARQMGLPTINYGLFLSNLLGFLAVLLIVWLTLKGIQRRAARSKQDAS